MSDEATITTEQEVVAIEHEVTVLLLPDHVPLGAAFRMAAEQNAVTIAAERFAREGLRPQDIAFMTIQRVDVKVAGADQVYWAAVFKARGEPRTTSGASAGYANAGQLADCAPKLQAPAGGARPIPGR